MQRVRYPTDMVEMKKNYKLCTTAKLFLHEMFPEVTAGIFLDTDTVVLEDISNLWSLFSRFDDKQVVSLAPVETHYSNVHDLPYYGLPGQCTQLHRRRSILFSFSKELVWMVEWSSTTSHGWDHCLGEEWLRQSDSCGGDTRQISALLTRTFSTSSSESLHSERQSAEASVSFSYIPDTCTNFPVSGTTTSFSANQTRQKTLQSLDSEMV